MNKVIGKETAKHYFWGENCSSWILADAEGLSVKQESMPSGTKEKLHFHTQAQQFFYILKGTATFYLNDRIEIVTEQKGILKQPKPNIILPMKPMTYLIF
jgi:mannose-6-phosphate isomerase-like protein (cupin superfamily)